FERVGGALTIRVDARIIAASNRDLEAEVAAHRFRDDLYYRLNVITLRVAPLRERKEDILPLADRLLQAATLRNRKPEMSFSPEAATAIGRYRWPGNIRELRNAVERAVVLAKSNLITPDYLPDSLFRESAARDPTAASPRASLEEVERDHIIRVLADSLTLEDAAETLGVDVSTLWRKRKRYKID
ncbi:MAG TPA: sigma 54-interacting transcriptional regulator, partial [Candidatus Binataceae bacterium]|nr:sigma 54-interacting transcriptional regulator [Candidatus Binataceae bacterium]